MVKGTSVIGNVDYSLIRSITMVGVVASDIRTNTLVSEDDPTFMIS